MCLKGSIEALNTETCIYLLIFTSRYGVLLEIFNLQEIASKF